MGIAGLRDAFNAVASPRYTANMALMGMEQADGKEWSRLTFRGIGADGVAFEVVSDRLPAGAALTVAAGETARQLLAK